MAHVRLIFSVCKTQFIFVNTDLSVCLSASFPYPGVTLAKCSTSDPWRLPPRRHRLPIALTQTLGLSQARLPAVPCVLTSRIGLDDINRSIFGAIKPPAYKETAARSGTQFNHNDECAGLSASILITAMEKCTG